MGTINYFGYGAMEDEQIIEAVLGRKPDFEPAKLYGFELCVQRIDQVPDDIVDTAPVQLSAQGILRQSWPDNFESYTIRAAASGVVRGTIWQLVDPLERKRLRDWELIDFGWFEDTTVTAETDEATVEVVTERLRAGQDIDRVVTGFNYPRLLQPKEKIIQVAHKARREFDDRLGG